MRTVEIHAECGLELLGSGVCHARLSLNENPGIAHDTVDAPEGELTLLHSILNSDLVGNVYRCKSNGCPSPYQLIGRRLKTSLLKVEEENRCASCSEIARTCKTDPRATASDQNDLARERRGG